MGARVRIPWSDIRETLRVYLDAGVMVTVRVRPDKTVEIVPGRPDAADDEGARLDARMDAALGLSDGQGD